MPKFDATINGISLASYGVEPNMATVPQPEAKTYQAEIPGRDGLLDYTDAYGVVRYENRTVTVEAYEIGDITARMEHRRAICSDMHGKTCTLELTTLPGYTFTGRCSVDYDEDGAETTYKLSFDCQPYMSAGERTFVGNCAGGVDLVFVSGDKPVKPRIEVPRYSIIIFNGQQYEVEAGTWTFDGVVFKRGRNELYINTYTEPGTTTWGDLESMTWEQIGWHHKTADASGALVNVTDALQARPNKLVVDGKAVQDGTPTPDVPVEVDVVDGPVSVVRTGANIIGALLRNNASAAVNVSQDMDNGTMSIRPDAPTSSWCNVTKMYYVGDNKTVNASVYANIATGLLHKLTIYNSIDGVRIGKQVGVSESIATSGTLRATGTVSTNYVAIRYWVNYSVVAAGTIAPTVFTEMMLNIGSTTLPYEPYTSTQQAITLPSDHNYLASLPDGTRDELVLRADGVAVLVERVGKFVFDGSADEVWIASVNDPVAGYFTFTTGITTSNGANLLCDRFTPLNSVSNNNVRHRWAQIHFYPDASIAEKPPTSAGLATWRTWLAANPVTVYYELETPATSYSADNGTTWSTTDPNAGNSAIQLYKGTNNVWCTDALSPNVTLNYDTQERTRKQRISELYWRNNPPQRRLTWGQLATHTWEEIGSKPVQEWYYSGTADVVENAYINYEIGDL